MLSLEVFLRNLKVNLVALTTDTQGCQDFKLLSTYNKEARNQLATLEIFFSLMAGGEGETLNDSPVKKQTKKQKKLSNSNFYIKKQDNGRTCFHPIFSQLTTKRNFLNALLYLAVLNTTVAC